MEGILSGKQNFPELARAVNFRDLGGRRNKDGREVRPGTLYRSAALWDLSSAQRQAVRALGVKSIVDFRFNAERDIHPTPWQELGCTQYWCRDYQPPNSGGGLDGILDDPEMTEAAAHDLMVRAYRHLPYHVVEGLHTLFDTVATGDGAFLFHCTSGKDRTGIAAALLLSVLGVPEEDILEDYLASIEFDILMSPAFKRDRPIPADRLQALKPIYSVHRDYLAATFQTLAEQDGSVEDFLEKKIGLDPKTFDAIRARLLV
jgi:protein-tyrosine phosphatase